MFYLAFLGISLANILLCPGNPVDATSSLELLPDEEFIVRLSGRQNSFFVSCKGAKNLIWKHKGTTGKEVTVSTSPLERVHVEPAMEPPGVLLVFRWLEMSDSGRYVCQEEPGHESKEFRMFVVQPIDFGQTPVDQSVQLGRGSHRLVCGVRGHPRPKVTWKAKGKTVRKSAGDKYELDGTDLIVRNINKEDEGSYLCKAVQTVTSEDTVHYSNFKDRIIEFKIEQEPQWIDSVGQFYGYVTGVANLTCQAEAEPPAVFSWMDAENRPVTQGIINSKYQSTLMVPVHHFNTFGAYTCAAENLHGRVEKVVMLTEGAKPGTPVINPKTIYADGLQLKITEPQAEMFLRVEGYQVEYKEVNSSWDRAYIVQLKLDSSSLYLIAELSSQTLYHVRAKARNKAGLSDPSNIIYFKTNGLSAQALNHTSGGLRTRDTGLLVTVLVANGIARWLR